MTVTRRRWLLVAGVVALAGAALAGFLAAGRGAVAPSPTPRGTGVPAAPDPSSPCPPGPPGPTAGHGPAGPDLAGLLIDPARVPATGALERCDRSAGGGQWTVVLRRPGGSLGRHGAVVTYPFPAPPGGDNGTLVNIAGVTGVASSGAVTWPLAGGYARVRGDLSQAELVAVAAGTGAVGGRPVVHPPAGLTVVSTGPYRPPSIHEVRYLATELGEQAALGDGLVYTGVTTGGGFEDRLYAQHAGLDASRPGVVSTVLGGNATLAWEPAPGIVAYVGYSGAPLTPAAAAALERLARRAVLLTTAQWRALHPQTVEAVNDFN
jgi:hypothetical protein